MKMWTLPECRECSCRHIRVLSRVEGRHEMRHDGDGNEENGGVRDRDLGGIGFSGGREGEDGGYCHVSRPLELRHDGDGKEEKVLHYKKINN